MKHTEEPAIENNEQLGKFAEALRRLSYAGIDKLPLSGTLNVAEIYGLLVGILTDNVVSKRSQTKKDIQDKLYFLQCSYNYRGLDDGINILRTTFARFAEQVDTAFDIAVNDQPLPDLPAFLQRGEGPVRKI